MAVDWRAYIPGFVLVITLTAAVTSVVFAIQPERITFVAASETPGPIEERTGVAVVPVMSRSNRNVTVTFDTAFAGPPGVSGRVLQSDGRFGQTAVGATLGGATRTEFQVHLTVNDFPWTSAFDRPVVAEATGLSTIQVQPTFSAVLYVDAANPNDAKWVTGGNLSGYEWAPPVAVGSAATAVTDVRSVDAGGSFTAVLAADTSDLVAFRSEDQVTWTAVAGAFGGSAAGTDFVDVTVLGASGIAVAAPVKPGFARQVWISSDGGASYGAAQTLNAGLNTKTAVVALASGTDLVVAFPDGGNLVDVWAGPAGALVNVGTFGNNVSHVTGFLDPNTQVPVIVYSDTAGAAFLLKATDGTGTAFGAPIDLKTNVGTSPQGFEAAVSGTDVFIVYVTANGLLASLLDVANNRACPGVVGPGVGTYFRTSSGVPGVGVSNLVTADGRAGYNFVASRAQVDWYALYSG